MGSYRPGCGDDLKRRACQKDVTLKVSRVTGRASGAQYREAQMQGGGPLLGWQSRADWSGSLVPPSGISGLPCCDASLHNPSEWKREWRSEGTERAHKKKAADCIAEGWKNSLCLWGRGFLFLFLFWCLSLSACAWVPTCVTNKEG